MITFGSDTGPPMASSSRGSRPANCCSAAAGDRRRAVRPASNPALSVSTVGVIDEGDAAARQTAESLASALGADGRRAWLGPVGLLVVGSRKEAPEGKVVLSAASDYAVEAANYPVLVIPRGTTVDFSGAPAAPAADAAPTV